jgi:uncharacterized protein
MRQTWRDLLFAHWAVPAEVLSPFIPRGLELQVEDGMSWVGVVPFRMTGVMLRGLPDLPWLSAFPELNLRLYVEHGGKPGVWFLSLDASNPLAVWAAKRFFHLPYVHAEISLTESGDTFAFASRRGRGPRAAFHAGYGPTGPVYESTRGTLEHFLTERYCLYARSRAGTLYRAEVQHVSWPLQPVEADLDARGLFEAHGLPIAGPPAYLHFARALDVVVWPLERLDTGHGASARRSA